jgi:hypothetical protein
MLGLSDRDQYSEQTLERVCTVSSSSTHVLLLTYSNSDNQRFLVIRQRLLFALKDSDHDLL